VERVALRAIAFTEIDLLAAMEVSVQRFGGQGAERADIRHDIHKLLLCHPCARHFGARYSESDNARESLIVSGPRQARLREVRAFTAVSLRAVANGAMRLKQLLASDQIRLSLRGTSETDS
jgi:hypothetical protein